MAETGFGKPGKIKDQGNCTGYDFNIYARTLQTLSTIYDRPAEWFTPRGHFTDEERQLFEASVTPWAAKWPDSDIVIKTYDQARVDLPEEAKRRIAQFIEYTQDMERRRVTIDRMWRANRDS